MRIFAFLTVFSLICAPFAKADDVSCYIQKLSQREKQVLTQNLSSGILYGSENSNYQDTDSFYVELISPKYGSEQSYTFNGQIDSSSDNSNYNFNSY